MKKIILALAAVVLAAGAAQAGLASDEPAEFSVQGQYWFPGEGDFDLVGSAYGVQASWREWVAFPFGVGFNVGIAQWNVDAHSNPYKWRSISDYDGDVTLIPIGLSLAYGLIDWNDWDVNLETGLQYVFVDSGVDCRSSDDGARHDIDIDNAVWWTVGAEFDYQITEGVYVVGGAGFQTDVVRAESDYDLGELRDTRFQAFYGKLGMKFLF